MAPQNETYPDFPNDIIIGVRSNDAISVYTRSVAENLVTVTFTEPRDFPGVDPVWQASFFMERAVFDALYAKMMAYIQANP